MVIIWDDVNGVPIKNCGVPFRKNLATELWEYSSFCFHRLVECRSWKGPYNRLVHSLHCSHEKAENLDCMVYRGKTSLDSRPSYFSPPPLPPPPPPHFAAFHQDYPGSVETLGLQNFFWPVCWPPTEQGFQTGLGSWVTRIMKSQVRPCKNETFIPVLEGICLSWTDSLDPCQVELGIWSFVPFFICCFVPGVC